MTRQNLHKVLVSLHNVCKVHSNNNKGFWLPKVNLEEQDIKTMNKEITKLINYLKHPHFSYLYK